MNKMDTEVPDRDAMAFLNAVIGSAKSGPAVVSEVDGTPETWVPDHVPAIGGTPPSPPSSNSTIEAPDISGLGNYFARSSYGKD